MKNEIKFLAVSLLILVVVFGASLSIIKYNNKSTSLTASTILSQESSSTILEINKEIETLASKNTTLNKTDPQITSLLDQRKTLLLEESKNNPREIYSVGLPSSTLEKLRLAGYKNIEKPITNLSGNLGITHYDDFDNPKNSFYEYYLFAKDGTKYRLYTSNEDALTPNTKIEIKNGLELGGNIFGEARSLLVSISAIPDIIATNTSTIIKWQVGEATSCVGSGGSPGWAGPKSITGGSFVTPKLTSNTSFTITCQNSYDTVTSSTTVTVVFNPITYIQNDLPAYVSTTTEPEPYKVGVFLINVGSGTPLFSKTEAEKIVFNGQVNEYIKEGSYGKRYLAGDVYGWIQTSLTTQACATDGLLYEAFLPEFLSYLQEHEIHLDNYDHIVFLKNCGGNNTAGGYSSVGKQSFNIGGITYNVSMSSLQLGTQALDQHQGDFPKPFAWTYLDGVLAHEFGHAIGLEHSHGLDCDSAPLSDNCIKQEYGNPFDVMGFFYANALHYSGFAKDALGWISPQQKLNVTSSGTYTINRFEIKDGIKLIKIRNPFINKTNMYTVENRRGIGFDSILNNPELSVNKNGLLINKKGFQNPYDTGWYLIDNTPTSETWQIDSRDTALVDSNIFYDAETGITIGPITKVTSTSITFKVKID